MLFIARNSVRYETDSERIPVYMQDWFIELAAGKAGAVRVTVADNNRPVASFVFSPYQNPLGMKQAYNLPWARVSGPIIDEAFDPRRRTQIVRDLVDQLPADRSYFLTLSNEQDFNAFLAAGFSGETEENFEIPFERALTWERQLSAIARRHVRRAKEDLDLSTLDPAEFIRIYGAHLAIRRRKPYSELSIAHDILVEAIRRGQARVTAARRRNTGEIDAAVACLWDDDKYYYWMTTRRPPVIGHPAPHQGAVKLLLHAAIKHAHQKGRTFDFDGVTSTSIAQLYAGMGGIRSFRYKVRRVTTCEQVAGLFRPGVQSVLRSTLGRLVPLKLNR